MGFNSGLKGLTDESGIPNRPKKILLSKLFLRQNVPQDIITEEEVQYGQLKIITLIAVNTGKEL
jgi:hypothetical protein